MAVLVTFMNEEDPIKNEGTSLECLQHYKSIFQTLKDS